MSWLCFDRPSMDLAALWWFCTGEPQGGNHVQSRRVFFFKLDFLSSSFDIQLIQQVRGVFRDPDPTTQSVRTPAGLRQRHLSPCNGRRCTWGRRIAHILKWLAEPKHANFIDQHFHKELLFFSRSRSKIYSLQKSGLWHLVWHRCQDRVCQCLSFRFGSTNSERILDSDRRSIDLYKSWKSWMSLKEYNKGNTNSCVRSFKRYDLETSWFQLLNVGFLLKKSCSPKNAFWVTKIIGICRQFDLSNENNWTLFSWKMELSFDLRDEGVEPDHECLCTGRPICGTCAGHWWPGRLNVICWCCLFIFIFWLSWNLILWPGLLTKPYHSHVEQTSRKGTRLKDWKGSPSAEFGPRVTRARTLAELLERIFGPVFWSKKPTDRYVIELLTVGGPWINLINYTYYRIYWYRWYNDIHDKSFVCENLSSHSRLQGLRRLKTWSARDTSLLCNALHRLLLDLLIDNNRLISKCTNRKGEQWNKCLCSDLTLVSLLISTLQCKVEPWCSASWALASLLCRWMP